MDSNRAEDKTEARPNLRKGLPNPRQIIRWRVGGLSGRKGFWNEIARKAESRRGLIA